MGVGRRTQWRDYVDIWYLLTHASMSLQQIIDAANQKFGGEFNETLFLEQLSYFDDLTSAPIDWINQTDHQEEHVIKDYLATAVTQHLKTKLP